MAKYVSIPAEYQPTGVSRYDGNPFIEALPEMEPTKDAILKRLRNYPAPPTQQERNLGEMVRTAELGRIKDLVYPFAEYRRAGANLTLGIRESYVARNPLHEIDLQRRLALATGLKETPLPSNWVSSATGQSLIGISGSGKTTFATAFAIPYQVVIEHREYKGKPLLCRQIPWVSLRMSHDATLKSLCLQFFSEVDSILGNTNYTRQAGAVRQIAQMSLLLAHVANVASLGIIFIDELQNLKAAKGGNAVFVLNLFSEIIERAGVSLVVAATPLVESVIDKNVRNIRKLNSGGESNFDKMRFGDPEYDAFCAKYWEYQFVQNPVRLTDDIKRAWFKASGGNPAFAALAFMLAQRNEIGGREVIDANAFERAARYSMSSLQPAIAVLLSNDPIKLRHFDDLLSTAKSLRSLIDWKDGSDAPALTHEEFDDIAPDEEDDSEEENAPEEAAAPNKAPAKPRKKKPKAASSVELPVETPQL